MSFGFILSRSLRLTTLFLMCFGLALLLALRGTTSHAQSRRWTEERANTWYSQQPWLVGSNYVPSDATNQLDMWQSDSFNPREIDREFGWAQAIGLNTMRVFLHDQLWKQDPNGFRQRIDTFLSIAQKHGIRPIFVLFDSCWDPNPRLGRQHPPIPGVHNSGWVQSPGANGLEHSEDYPRLREYVVGVIGAFANDERILAWDVWNEPDNPGGGNYNDQEPSNKSALVNSLLPQVFDWARSAQPIQPLTSGVWTGNWSATEKLSETELIQIENSDIVSFHDYSWPEVFAQKIHQLRRYNRPVLCTEYMARGAGSTVDGTLPIAQKERVAAYNWGLVEGKTQTFLPWDSWKRPYIDVKPVVWFHDLFRSDGSLYRSREGELIKQLIYGSAAAH